MTNGSLSGAGILLGTRNVAARYAVPILAVILFVVYSLLEPGVFFSWGNVRAMLNSQAIVLLLANAAGDALSLFTTLALLSTFVYVFGYVLSVAAELLHALTDDAARVSKPRVATAVLALAFAIWMAGAAGPSAVE